MHENVCVSIIIQILLLKVMRFPIEECSSNVTCSNCIIGENPLCGWCVVENKCSRQSLCQNGDSMKSTRWIPSDPSAEISRQCIFNTISPNQFLLDDQQVVSILHVCINIIHVIFVAEYFSGQPWIASEA